MMESDPVGNWWADELAHLLLEVPILCSIQVALTQGRETCSYVPENYLASLPYGSPPLLQYYYMGYFE